MRILRKILHFLGTILMILVVLWLILWLGPIVWEKIHVFNVRG